jgi:hypothetical protein
MYSKALSHDAKPLYLQMWCIDAIGYKNVISPSNTIVQYTKYSVTRQYKAIKAQCGDWPLMNNNISMMPEKNACKFSSDILQCINLWNAICLGILPSSCCLLVPICFVCFASVDICLHVCLSFNLYTLGACAVVTIL